MNATIISGKTSIRQHVGAWTQKIVVDDLQPEKGEQGFRCVVKTEKSIGPYQVIVERIQSPKTKYP